MMTAKRIVLASVAAILLLIVGSIIVKGYTLANKQVGPEPNVRMERGVVTALDETGESSWRMELAVEDECEGDSEQIRVFLVSKDSLAAPLDFAVGDVIEVPYFINYDVQGEGRLSLTTAHMADP